MPPTKVDIINEEQMFEHFKHNLPARADFKRYV